MKLLEKVTDISLLWTKRHTPRKFLRNFVGNYFENSYSQMVSFLTRSENIDLKELEDILQKVKEAQQAERKK